jgi:phosphinothricin acetyltransferase
MHIAPVTPEHADAVLAIYREGIATGNATFETEPPGWEDFYGGKLPEHRHVVLDEHDQVLGWVAASEVSSRCVYAGSSSTPSTSPRPHAGAGSRDCCSTR